MIKIGKEFDSRKLAYDLLSVLAHIEKQGISHRKVNPYSIFFKDGCFKLSLGSSFCCIRKPEKESFYQSPEVKEVLNGPGRYKEIRFIKSDVYSFGATLFKAITKENYLSPDCLRKIKNHDLGHIVQSSLEANPDSRPLFKTLLNKLG